MARERDQGYNAYNPDHPPEHTITVMHVHNADHPPEKLTGVISLITVVRWGEGRGGSV